MDKMRVLFISSWGKACGIATYSANLIEQLEAQGVHVEVYSDTKNFNGLAKLAKESTADVVHIQHEFGISMPSEPLMSIIAKFRAAGKAVVMTLHTEDKGVNILLDGVLDAAIVHADKFNMAGKNTFTPFHKIPHGIPEISFPDVKGLYKKKYGLPADALILGTCGFISKSRAEMLESFVAAIAPRMVEHNICLHFVTSAHANDPGGNYAKSIKASILSIAAQHKVADRIYMTADFMDTTEFRERIYTLDLGFAYADLGVASNSGAAADIISCGVPVVINNSPHFSHVAPYCTVAGDTLADVITAIEKYDPLDPNHIVKGPRQAIEDLGYSVIAKRHIAIYQDAVLRRNNQVSALANPVTEKIRPLSMQQPIVVTMPNSMWQVLLLWSRLKHLVSAGHTIQFVVQADGTTDLNLLKWCLPGIAGVTFTDVGMVNDPRLVRLHSRSCAQNMTTDIEAWIREGNQIQHLFDFLPVSFSYDISLGDSACKDAAELASSGRNGTLFVVPAFGQNAELYEFCKGTVENQNIQSVIILCTPTRNTREVLELKDMLEANPGIQDVRVVVENVRTNLACALQPTIMVTGWNELAVLRILRGLPTHIVCSEAWEGQLVEQLLHFVCNKTNVPTLPISILVPQV